MVKEPKYKQAPQIRTGGGDSLLKKWKIGCFLLAILVIILIIALIVVSSKRSHKSEPVVTKCPTKPDKKVMIPKGLPSDTAVTSLNPSIFQDLTPEELNYVRDIFLNDKTMNLTPYQNATLTHNYIYSIELLLPPKKSVLAYLRTAGRPNREAKVVIFNGAQSPPNVKEYIVSFPGVNVGKLRRLKPADREIPFAFRPMSEIENKASQMFLGYISKRYPYFGHIIMESFDAHFLHPKHKLVTNPGGSVFDITGKRRLTWIGVRRMVEGWYLHNLPLEVLMDHTANNFLQYKVLSVYYNEQYFKTLKDFITKYQQNKLKKIKVPWPTNEEILKGSMRKRGDPFFASPMMGPTLVEPHGRRFSIRRRKITYTKWSFEIGSKVMTGPVVYNIKYGNRDIAYEISLQEMASYYSAHNPQQAASEFLETFLGIGAKYSNLVRGVDCPLTAEFIDFHVYLDAPEAKTMKNAFCVFEMNEPLPSRTHVEVLGRQTMAYGGLPDYALYVRSISVVGNYDYIIDFVFHQNGVLELKTTASGYLNTNYYYKNEDDFGFQQYKGTIGTIHDHAILYKVDLDVDGTQNSFQTLDIVPREVRQGFDNKTVLIQKFVEKRVRKTEKSATIKYDFNKPKYYTFINKNKNNTFGYPVGYRLAPRSMVKQVYPDAYPLVKGSAWSKYQIAVTKRKESERDGSSAYNQYSMGKPIINFDDFIKDDDNIDNEDLVAWVNVGALHIPSNEDIPNTVTSGSSFSFYLKPYGFFESDPTMGSRESVMISHGKIADYGLKTVAACPTINRTLG